MADTYLDFRVEQAKEFQPVTITLKTEAALAEFYLLMNGYDVDSEPKCGNLRQRMCNSMYDHIMSDEKARKVLGL